MMTGVVAVAVVLTLIMLAGVFAMPFWRFQIANFTSAFVWAASLLLLGDVVSRAIGWLWSWA